MNTNKHFSAKAETPNSKLQKSTVIFMQLGLILALFAVYLALEYKTIKKHYIFKEPKSVAMVDVYVPDAINVIEPKKKQLQKPVAIKKIKTPKPVVDKVNVIDDSKKIVNALPKELLSTEDNQNTPQLNINDIPSVEEPDTENKEDVPFVKVEIKPTFYKCKDKKGEAKKKCFNKILQKHINKYFDVDLAQNLGLSEGQHRIYVQFVIDKNGDITNVHSNATHPRLKKEAERVVKKLPKMVPGKQRTHFVNVQFNLPINFNVEN